MDEVLINAWWLVRIYYYLLLHYIRRCTIYQLSIWDFLLILFSFSFVSFLMQRYITMYSLAPYCHLINRKIPTQTPNKRTNAKLIHCSSGLTFQLGKSSRSWLGQHGSWQENKECFKVFLWTETITLSGRCLLYIIITVNRLITLKIAVIFNSWRWRESL